MVGDKVVFEAAKAVIEKLGSPVYPVKLDPFIEKAVKYNDDALEIYLIRQLGATDGGDIIPVIRMMISADADWIGDDEIEPMNEDEIEEEEEEEYEDDLGDTREDLWWGPEDQVSFPVFDYAITEQGAGGTYLFMPGPWLNWLQTVYLELDKQGL